jgi:quaternary ammonium compound-resistance protein SugE
MKGVASATIHEVNMFVSLSTTAAWLLLFIAGLLEIVWSVSMKASVGFTKHYFTALTLAAAWLSFWLLGLAMRTLPVGTAYAVWTGIGAVGAAMLGVVLFGEALTLPRVVCICLIVVGILGLKLFSGDGVA